MRFELLTAPTADAIPLGQARRWLAFGANVVSDDDLLTELISSVVSDYERETNRKLLSQTWYLWLDATELDDMVRVPPPLIPLVSVSDITMYDSDDVASVVASTNYQVVTGDNPRITLTDDGEWEDDDLRDYDAVRVTLVAGAGGAKRYWWGPYSDVALDDLVASGTSAETSRTRYEVVVTATGTPDVFKWRSVTRDVSGFPVYSAWTTGVNVTTTTAAVGTGGLSLRWLAATGHTVGDTWLVERVELIPEYDRLTLQGLVQFWYRTKGTGLLVTEAGLAGLPRTLQARIDGRRATTV